MITDIEKQFFDTFGIEPKKQCYYWDCPYSTGNIANDTPMNERDCGSCKNPDKEIYPQITDSILLKLICILTRYYLDEREPYEITSINIEQLKQQILSDIICIADCEATKCQVQKIFKEI